MLRKFLEGLVFGSGFAIACLTVVMLAGSIFMPMIFRSGEPPTTYTAPDRFAGRLTQEEGPPFHELSIEEQIEQSSVIALARFEPATDGRMKAIFTEFLKRDPAVSFYYDIGDEYPSASFYPEEGRSMGDGMVAFFVGSPADMRMSMSYAGDRIRGLGDIPLELFREKCEATD